MDAFIIITTGALVAMSCGLLGGFLILRKMAMVSDAISHAVLPGIVIAYLIMGADQTIWMLLGAGLFGMLTTFLIEFFNRKGKLQSDASIGVTFTWLFALGVILVTYYAGNAHIDQECVLYGEIAYVPLDLFVTSSGKVIGPRALIVLSVVFVLVLLFVVFAYKELYITTFDPVFATLNGFSSTAWHYMLMSMVSLTTVASFESVGAILVVAFLVVPAATAYLLTDNLKMMLAISMAIGVVVSVSGYYLAYALNGSIAGAMATVAGILFMVVFLVSLRLKKAAQKANPGDS